MADSSERRGATEVVCEVAHNARLMRARFNRDPQRMRGQNREKIVAAVIAVGEGATVSRFGLSEGPESAIVSSRDRSALPAGRSVRQPNCI